MKCPKCGNTLAEGAKFCPKCGARMGVDNTPPPRKRSNAPLIIAICAAVLIIGGGAVGTVLFVASRHEEKTTVTEDVWKVPETGETERAGRAETAAETAAPSPTAETAAAAPAVSMPVATAPAQSNISETPAGVEGYILADSSVRYLSEQDLAGLSSDQLRIARNEIYARHGRKFKDEQLQSYFNSQSWYSGTIEPDRFSDDALLNDVERKNLELIKAREAVLN